MVGFLNSSTSATLVLRNSLPCGRVRCRDNDFDDDAVWLLLTAFSWLLLCIFGWFPPSVLGWLPLSAIGWPLLSMIGWLLLSPVAGFISSGNASDESGGGAVLFCTCSRLFTVFAPADFLLADVVQFAWSR